MAKKYKFNYLDFDYDDKDEMLWEYDNFIIGISLSKDHYTINHYNKDFDKSEYIECDLDYTLKQYGRDWFSWILDNADME